MYLADSRQIRSADRILMEEKKLPGILLMEQAGKLSAETILARYPAQTSFLVLAGPGNNGGDGLVIARYLHLAGKDVKILFSHDPSRYQGDAAINYEIITHLPILKAIYGKEDTENAHIGFVDPPVLIDALLGTGIESELRGSVAEVISEFARTNLPVIAIDLPSGLDASTGAVVNAVLEAELTLTFQLPKVCHYITPAANLCGEVVVLDIGIWPEVVESLWIQRRLITETYFRSQYLRRKNDGHKGSYGHVLLVGGSRNMAGAITLAAMGCIHSGAGLCTVFTPDSCRQAVFSAVPEVMCVAVGDPGSAYMMERDANLFREILAGKTAVVVGPGMGQHVETQAFLAAILPMIEVPLILDADALNILALRTDLWNYLPENTILTPHPGEMQRLTRRTDVNERRLETVEELAAKRRVISLLKGAGTIVATPGGTAFVNTSGNPGMATGGSGDVLSGIIGSLCAQGYSPEIAAALGVYLHGKAGDTAAAKYGQEGVTAKRITEAFSFL
ncbi:MAG: NAD(P)H-hydrate dehydratase [Bacteroidia bacterium]|nr:NAD(P)H-hydrate dehydratase [Bacteroidia bacterium]